MEGYRVRVVTLLLCLGTLIGPTRAAAQDASAAVDAGDAGLDASDAGLDASDAGLDASDAGLDAGDGGLDKPDASALRGALDAGTEEDGLAADERKLLEDERLPPPPPPPEPTPTMRVGVAGSEPFVVDENGELTGLSVETWREATTRAHVNYDFVRMRNPAAAIAALARGELDAVVGPISITAERAQHVEFTQPHFHASLAIAAPPTGTLWDHVAPFISEAFFTGLGVLFVILLIVGTLFWLTERKANTEQFPNEAAAGIGNGIWLALVTMTTVGYGDRSPVTLGGRIVAGVWMVLSMIIASSLIASIATALTLAQLDRSAIDQAEQLDGRRIAVVHGSTAVGFVAANGGRSVHADSIDGAIEHVIAGRAECIVSDRPVLGYHLRQNPDIELQLSDASYEPQGYGFAVMKGSGDLRERLDIALLEYASSREAQLMRQRWLGE